jgi:hypothetical protein
MIARNWIKTVGDLKPFFAAVPTPVTTLFSAGNVMSDRHERWIRSR